MFTTSELNADALFEQVEDTRICVKLWLFLRKLDSRFGDVDPWFELQLAQRYYSRP